MRGHSAQASSFCYPKDHRNKAPSTIFLASQASSFRCWQDGESQDGGLVFSWAEHRVCLYLQALRQHLPGITEGGSLASVLEHCMYCGMSLARVGLDIRGLLPPIFEACVLNLFSKVPSAHFHCDSFPEPQVLACQYSGSCLCDSLSMV